MRSPYSGIDHQARFIPQFSSKMSLLKAMPSREQAHLTSSRKSVAEYGAADGVVLNSPNDFFEVLPLPDAVTRVLGGYDLLNEIPETVDLGRSSLGN